MEKKIIDFKKQYYITIYWICIISAVMQILFCFFTFTSTGIDVIIRIFYFGFMILSFLSCLQLINKCNTMADKKMYKTFVMFFYLVPIFFMSIEKGILSFAETNYELIQFIFKMDGVIYLISFFIISTSLCKSEHKKGFIIFNTFLLLAVLSLISVEYITNITMNVEIKFFRKPYPSLSLLQSPKNFIQRFGYLLLGIYLKYNK